MISHHFHFADDAIAIDTLFLSPPLLITLFHAIASHIFLTDTAATLIAISAIFTLLIIAVLPAHSIEY
jgi:hypothetical protein